MAKEQYIIQLGLGKVGQELIHQVEALWQQGRANHLRYLGLADHSAMLFQREGFSAAQIATFRQLKADGGRLADEGAGVNVEALLSGLAAQGIEATFVDLTATASTAPLLTAARAAGHNLVFANKAPFAATYAEYKAIAPALPGAAVEAGWGKVRHEATVGAGLPVISTIESLLMSGDQIERIEASVSGTLGYICAALDGGLSFSQALRQAHALGYTEPDPRDDLNGLDAARKALILARRMGIALELADVSVESLVPPGLEQVGLDEFWARLVGVDDTYHARLALAQKNGKVLRYAALIEDGKASVGLREVAVASPLGRLQGSDSIFIWQTARYHDTPLVVQGLGAGPAVTAAGVLTDILSL